MLRRRDGLHTQVLAQKRITKRSDLAFGQASLTYKTHRPEGHQQKPACPKSWPHCCDHSAKCKLPSLRLPRESRLAPQHPRPIADLRLCAPPPEHRHVTTAPANRSRPPSPPCSYPALRLLSACPSPAIQIDMLPCATESCVSAYPLAPAPHNYQRIFRKTPLPIIVLLQKLPARAARLSFVQVCEATSPR